MRKERARSLEVAVAVDRREHAVVLIPTRLERAAADKPVLFHVEQVGVVARDPQLEIEIDHVGRVVDEVVVPQTVVDRAVDAHVQLAALDCAAARSDLSRARSGIAYVSPATAA